MVSRIASGLKVTFAPPGMIVKIPFVLVASCMFRAEIPACLEKELRVNYVSYCLSFRPAHHGLDVLVVPL